MKKKLILFAGAFGILAGSLAYSQQGGELPLPENVVVGRFYLVADPGEYGVHVVLQKGNGETCSLPRQGVVKMKDGTGKKIDDVQIGDELF